MAEKVGTFRQAQGKGRNRRIFDEEIFINRAYAKNYKRIF
jgi:hypothetical protein